MNSSINAKKERRGLFAGSVPFSPQQNRILNIFFYTILGAAFVSLLGALLYYVFAYAALTSGDHSFDWLLGIFSDFVFIMNVSIEESPYLVEDSSYPPIAIMVLYPFALICKDAFAQYADSILTVDELTSAMVLHPEFWVAIMLFFVLCSLAVILAVTYKFKLPFKQSIKVGIIILCSAPFVYAVMRGNTIYFAMIFLLLFLLLYDSKSPVLREISYVCLTISGLIKIYPLFFGVFLLHKKRLLASIRVGIYTVTGFFMSFMLFERGLKDLEHFIHNLSGFSGDVERLYAGNNLSITALVYKIFGLFVEDPTAVPAYDVVNIGAMLLIFAVATVFAIAASSDFSRYTIAAAVVVLIPSVSYFYVLIFAMLPFMEFLRHYDDFPKYKQRIYFWLFLLLLFTPLIITQFFVPHTLVVLTLFGMECVSVFKKDFLKTSQPLPLAE